VEGLLAKIGFKMKAGFATVAAIAAMSCGEELEVRTFELSRLDANEAEALIAPYVFEGREGAEGRTSLTEGVLTVREMPENLARIAEVLERYDRAVTDVRLHFQIIEADGFTETDEAIAEVETELKKILRYRGYRLLGEAIMQMREGGGYAQQRVLPGVVNAEYGNASMEIRASIGRVARAGDAASVVLDVGLQDDHGIMLNTTVTIVDGKTLVLGTTGGQILREGRRSGALILVVTPTID
jgi:hypothetical protein